MAPQHQERGVLQTAAPQDRNHKPERGGALRELAPTHAPVSNSVPQMSLSNDRVYQFPHVLLSDHNQAGWFPFIAALRPSTAYGRKFCTVMEKNLHAYNTIGTFMHSTIF